MPEIEKFPKLSSSATNLGNAFAFVYRRVNHESFEGTFHIHQGMEFLYVHEGQGRLTLNQKTFPVGPGMLLLFQPFQLHELQFEITPESPFVRSIVVIEPALLEPSLANFPHLAGFFQHLWHDTLEPNFVTGLEDGNPLDTLLRRFSQDFRVFKGSSEERREEIILFLIDFLRRQRPYWQAANREASAQPPSHPVELVMDWIEKNYREEFRLDNLAAELHLSPFYLSRLFRTATGSTITQYLTERRIREACLLLQTSSLAVNYVGEAVGFNTPSYFNQLFKKNTGLTPQQYRFNSAKANR